MADTARLSGRQSWLRTQANSLVDRLKSRAMELPVAAAEVIVADRVAAVAATLQISERAARAYFDQDALDGIADGLAASVADEEPGVDLLTLPCDAALSISGVGRLFAALGQCADFFASYAVVNEALSHNRGEAIGDLVLILGLFQADHKSGEVLRALGENRGGTPGRMSMASRGGGPRLRGRRNSARCGRRRFCCLRTRSGR